MKTVLFSLSPVVGSRELTYAALEFVGPVAIGKASGAPVVNVIDLSAPAARPDVPNVDPHDGSGPYAFLRNPRVDVLPCGELNGGYATSVVGCNDFKNAGYISTSGPHGFPLLFACFLDTDSFCFPASDWATRLDESDLFVHEPKSGSVCRHFSPIQCCSYANSVPSVVAA